MKSVGSIAQENSVSDRTVRNWINAAKLCFPDQITGSNGKYSDDEIQLVYKVRDRGNCTIEEFIKQCQRDRGGIVPIGDIQDTQDSLIIDFAGNGYSANNQPSEAYLLGSTLADQDFGEVERGYTDRMAIRVREIRSLSSKLFSRMRSTVEGSHPQNFSGMGAGNY